MRIRSGVVAAVLLGVSMPASAQAGTLLLSQPACDRCTYSIWTANDDGGDLRRLTPPQKSRFEDPIHPSHEGDQYPVWSSDGSRIAFDRQGIAPVNRLGQEPEEPDGLWVMNADGSDAHKVSADVLGISAWSANDDLFLFSERRHDETGGLPDQPSQNPINIGDSDVFTMRTDGSGVTRIVNSPIEDGNPRYSADGTRIIFDRALYGGFPDPRTGTYSVRLDGTDERRLSWGPPGRVVYSPDGEYGVYAWAGRLWIMNADGSERRDATPPGYWVHGWGPFVWGTDAGAAGPILFFPGTTTDTVNTGNWEGGTFRLDVGDPAARALILPGLNGVVDWKPAADDPERRFVDRAAPAAFFLLSPKTAVPSAAAAHTLTRRALALVAADATGIRRIRLAFARKVRRRGATLCRFAGPAGLGKPRRCDRPRFLRGTSEEELLAPVKRLRPGPYVTGFSTVDVLRNRSRKLRLRPVRLR
jgi:hypothetical protein